MTTPAHTLSLLRNWFEHALYNGFIGRRLVLFILKICCGIPELDSFQDTEYEHFILDSGIVHMFLRKHDALLTVQLTICCPSQESPAEKPVLCVGEGETTDRFFELIPLILRIDVQTSLKTTKNDKVFVGSRNDTFA